MLKKILFLLLLTGTALFITGCESANEDESGLPWSRPASWEGQAPGMGSPGAPGRSGY